MNHFQDYGLLLQSIDNAGTTTATTGAEAGAPNQAPGGLFGSNSMLIFMLPLLVLLMFTMGGGNRRRQKEMQAMLASLEKGDKVQSIGGIIGTIAHVKEGSVVIKVDENTKLEFATSAVQTVLEKKNPVATPPKKGLFDGLKDKIGGKKSKEDNAEAAPADSDK